MLARLEDGKLPGFSCSINYSHRPPVWACDCCGSLRCSACMKVHREAGTILCWNCARPLILQGCTSLYRVEEFYDTMGLRRGRGGLADDPSALSSTGAAAIGADTPLGSSAPAAASGAPTDSRTASPADDAPASSLPPGIALLDYSCSWCHCVAGVHYGSTIGE